MIQRKGVRNNHLDQKFVQMTIHGRIDDVLSTKSPVDLKDMFGKTLHGSGIILIEGAPGSGKSTVKDGAKVNFFKYDNTSPVTRPSSAKSADHC